MADVDTIPPDVKGQIEQIGSADLVIGLPGCENGDAVAAAARNVRAAFQAVSPALKVVLVHSFGAAIPANGSMGEPEPDPNPRLLAFPRAAGDPMLTAANSPGTFRDIFTVSHLLGGRACAVMGSDVASITSESMRRLTQPVLHQNSDLVLACYPRHKFDTLINSSIVYPLLRALYGKRVQSPMARDIGFSNRAIDHFLMLLNGAAASPRSGSPAWMVTEAVTDGLQISQTYLATRLQPPKTAGDVGSVLVEVLGPIFLDIERTASVWQKVRGSQPIPTFGEQAATAEDSSPVDVSRMIESFRLGFRDLGEVWNLILPPAAMIDLKKLAARPPDQFRMPDELWVRIVYDFSLGFRLRVMNRDHLLRALTPTYLAWVASYALEMQSAGPFEVEERIEGLCRVYEAQKPYLQSRWRWPDRFNP